MTNSLLALIIIGVFVVAFAAYLATVVGWARGRWQ
jgi:hypothetical protein